MKNYALLCLSLRLIGSLFVGMIFAYIIGQLFIAITAWIVIACPVFNSLFNGQGFVGLPMLYKTETWHYRCIDAPIYSFFVSIVLIWGVLSVICLLGRVFSGLLKKIAKQSEFLYFMSGLGVLVPFTSDVDYYMVFHIWRFPFYRAYLILVVSILLISVMLYYAVFRLSLKSERYEQVDSFIKLNLKLYFWFIMLCCVALLLAKVVV